MGKKLRVLDTIHTFNVIMFSTSRIALWGGSECNERGNLCTYGIASPDPNRDRNDVFDIVLSRRLSSCWRILNLKFTRSIVYNSSG